MDNNTLTIIGLVLTVLFGIPAYLALRDKPKTKIFFFKRYELMLYDNLIKNIPRLDVNFDGRPIKDNMFVLKGIFICSGKKDIVVSDVSKGIILNIIGQNAVWHTHEIIKKTGDLEINKSSSSSKLTVNFPLMKDKDYFVLEALGECEKLPVRITNRIEDLPEIESNTAGVEKVTIIKLIVSIVLWLVFAWLFLLLFFMSFRENLTANFYNKYKDAVTIDTIKKNDPNLAAQLISIENQLYDSVENNYNRFTLALGGETKYYKISPDYLATFSVEHNEGDLIVLAVLCIELLITFYIVKHILKYRRYRKVASFAYKLLE